MHQVDVTEMKQLAEIHEMTTENPQVEEVTTENSQVDEQRTSPDENTVQTGQSVDYLNFILKLHDSNWTAFSEKTTDETNLP